MSKVCTCPHCGRPMMGENDLFEPGDAELIGIGLKAMHDRDIEEFRRFCKSLNPISKPFIAGEKIGDTIQVRKPSRYFK